MNTERVKESLRTFDFQGLFLDGLGWDALDSTIPLKFGDQTITLQSVAEKRGMTVYLCPMPAKSFDYPSRCRIEAQLSKCVREHLIVFTDKDRGLQIWQWVKREPGKPLARREHAYNTKQTGDALIQKLEYLRVTLEEEEKTTLPDITGKAKKAFDLEKITKRFYERFKTEHVAFLKFIEGIPDEDLERWYASVMINRLMFIYFIQKKGFLDNNKDYLRTKLNLAKDFYSDFLCPLFFDGFAKKESERSPSTNKLLGKVPYLNGGIFQPHQIEQHHGKTIEISNKAFEKLFAFFEEWDWHLDDRPTHNDREINPDVLGYIFEKYINQKQMGAYYTKEDITEYISKNTIVPRLFDMAKAKCKVAFEGEHSIWNLLKADPDRYIYDAVKHGVAKQLPKEIALGINDVSKRAEWNKYAPLDHALPTEIWRETVARRQRYEEIRQKLADGQIREINDLITLNLNIRQFAQDVIENSEGPELLVAFWRSIVGHIPENSNEKHEQGITILDPTCGSGAFLFAALNILESLYEACLDRMQAFLDEWSDQGKRKHPNYHKLFAEVLERVDEHPNRRYFIFKTIILNNLYGVDIMEEAVEICKLRLFLKLVAQVDTAERIEPLPDIDFNICSGNTLVGFATEQQAEDILRQDLLAYNTVWPDIKRNAEDAANHYQLFKDQQTKYGGQVTPEDKKELVARLRLLEDKLNRYLATDYGKDASKKKEYETWLKAYQPFHWFIEFYGIISKSGFDVIIGNPPYAEYAKVKKDYVIRGYETEACGNLYAYVIERCMDTLRNTGRMGMIVQLPMVCTDRMKSLQVECLGQSSDIWFATFDDRPARLFDGLEHIRATIFSLQKGAVDARRVFSTAYNRWYSEARLQLFQILTFSEISACLMDGAIPKIGQATALSVRQRLEGFQPAGRFLHGTTPDAQVFFHNAPQYWIRAMDYAPYFWNERGGEQFSTQVKTIQVGAKDEAAAIVATLNSGIFYWWFLILSDCRHLNLREIERFPLGLDQMSESIKVQLAKLARTLMMDFRRNKKRKECQYQTTGKVIYDEYYPKLSKPIIDEIDRVLAKHYGFTDEELDFIINYDIKYRMGLNGDSEEDAEA